MSVQRGQNHKRPSKSDSEWLDELINIIDRLKDKLQLNCYKLIEAKPQETQIDFIQYELI